MEDWNTLLGENPRIAPDIHFKIIEEVFVDGSREAKTQMFGAHKFVLAMVSDVFNALFFGTMREETEEILIRDTTIAAFKEFLKIIYILADTKILRRCETQVTDVRLLFEILNLTKRYMIPKAVSFIEERLSSVNLTETNVVPTVILAQEYKELEGFQAISEEVLKTCSHFLQATFSTNSKLLRRGAQFLAQVETTFSSEWLCLVVQLLARANCTNCNASPCLHGKEVTDENAVVGARVIVVDDKGARLETCPDGHGIIEKDEEEHFPWWIYLVEESRPLCGRDTVTFACS